MVLRKVERGTNCPDFYTAGGISSGYTPVSNLDNKHRYWVLTARTMLILMESHLFLTPDVQIASPAGLWDFAAQEVMVLHTHQPRFNLLKEGACSIKEFATWTTFNTQRSNISLRLEASSINNEQGKVTMSFKKNLWNQSFIRIKDFADLHLSQQLPFWFKISTTDLESFSFEKSPSSWQELKL